MCEVIAVKEAIGHVEYEKRIGIINVCLKKHFFPIEKDFLINKNLELDEEVTLLINYFFEKGISIDKIYNDLEFKEFIEMLKIAQKYLNSDKSCPSQLA